MERLNLLALLALLAMSTSVLGQLPVWQCTLDDEPSITTTNGYISDGPATFVPGAINNALAGNNSAYARWDDADVGAIFDEVWDNDLGITVDFYFQGDHWATHVDDSGLWGIARRVPDHFLLIHIRDGSPRVVIREYGGAEYEYHMTGLTLANDVTYRLTLRQANGQLDFYLDGGAYSNDVPVFSSGGLPADYTWDMVPAGGSPPRQMNIGRRPIFDGLLQNGEWVDNVRVYNGFWSPTEIDEGGRPAAVITPDVTSGFDPLMVNFDGTGSYDTDGTDVITLYEWDFTDDGTVDVSGNEVAAGNVSHTYSAPGTYVCRLTVTDDENETATTTVTINVYAPPPPGVLAVTSMLPDGGPHVGSQILTSITTAGPYTITNLVGATTAEIDGGSGSYNDGLCDLPASGSVLGLELGRMISGEGAGGRFYFPIAINGDGTGRPDLFVLEHAGTPDNFSVELLTNEPGEGTVIASAVPIRDVDYDETTTLMTSFAGGIGGVGIDLDALVPAVSDIRGVQLRSGTGIDPCLVAAVPPPGFTIGPVPIANAVPNSGGFPLLVTLDSCGSFDPDGSIASYEWDFTNDGGTDAFGDTAVHTYGSVGLFTAKLTVTDDDALSAIDTVDIDVTGPTPKRAITALVPSGALPAGSHALVSITTEMPGGGQSFVATDLVGPPDVTHVEAIGDMTARGVADTPQEAMVGVELGAYVTSLHVGESLSVFFPEELAINGDGTDAPEIFIIEQTIITDNFQVELLPYGPGGGGSPVAVVSVSSFDYGPTATSVDRDGTADTMGGMGIDLDALGVGGVRGVRIPGDDGTGEDSGLDPVIIAGVPDRCSTPFADADGDGDVDGSDFGEFQACFTGSLGGAAYDPANCFCFDRNGDSVIDEPDYNMFEDCATGPGIPWTQELTPACSP